VRVVQSSSSNWIGTTVRFEMTSDLEAQFLSSLYQAPKSKDPTASFHLWRCAIFPPAMSFDISYASQELSGEFFEEHSCRRIKIEGM